MERIILHCDLNNFFASVECRDHPELKDRPIAVCGSVEDRHGIVLAKNEPAKRYGIKTAETVWQAKKKCPDLFIVPPHFNRYYYFSKVIKQIYLCYTNQVESFGIDECWLDVTGSTRLFGSGVDIAEEIRARTKAEAGLTVSIGVSFNKIFAKLGSDLKKPDAITQISRDNFKQKIWSLPVDAMLGVGKMTGKRLKELGIRTIGDLAAMDSKYIVSIFGKAGQDMWRNANGLDLSEVAQADSDPTPKSIGNSVTCVHDLFDVDEVWPVLLHLSEKISGRMRDAGLIASGIQLSVKDSHLRVTQHQMHFSAPTRLTLDLAGAAKDMFQKNYRWKSPVRALGISGFALVPESEMQQASFFQNILQNEKNERLESQMEALREKFGSSSITRASLMQSMPLPGGRDLKK